MNKKLTIFLCILPIAGIVLWILTKGNIGLLLAYGLILVCPLSHIFLMKHNGHEQHNNTKGGVNL